MHHRRLYFTAARENLLREALSSLAQTRAASRRSNSCRQQAQTPLFYYWMWWKTLAKDSVRSITTSSVERNANGRREREASTRRQPNASTTTSTSSGPAMNSKPSAERRHIWRSTPRSGKDACEAAMRNVRSKSSGPPRQLPSRRFAQCTLVLSPASQELAQGQFSRLPHSPIKHPEAAAAAQPEDVRRVQEEMSRPDPKMKEEIRERLEAVIQSPKRDV